MATKPADKGGRFIVLDRLRDREDGLTAVQNAPSDSTPAARGPTRSCH
jgi:hypothetical protein